jgi:hypothetical protein
MRTMVYSCQGSILASFCLRPLQGWQLQVGQLMLFLLFIICADHGRKSMEMTLF